MRNITKRIFIVLFSAFLFIVGLLLGGKMMSIKKVIVDGETKLDLSLIQANSGDVREGVQFIDANGNCQVGTMTTLAKPEETKDVDLNFSSGSSQIVLPNGSNSVLSSVTVLKPDELVPENIRDGVTIAGVTGTYDGPGITYHNINFDFGYCKIKYQDRILTEMGDIQADADRVLQFQVIDVDDKFSLKEENISIRSDGVDIPFAMRYDGNVYSVITYSPITSDVAVYIDPTKVSDQVMFTFANCALLGVNTQENGYMKHGEKLSFKIVSLPEGYYVGESDIVMKSLGKNVPFTLRLTNYPADAPLVCYQVETVDPVMGDISVTITPKIYDVVTVSYVMQNCSVNTFHIGESVPETLPLQFQVLPESGYGVTAADISITLEDTEIEFTFDEKTRIVTTKSGASEGMVVTIRAVPYLPVTYLLDGFSDTGLPKSVRCSAGSTLSIDFSAIVLEGASVPATVNDILVINALGSAHPTENSSENAVCHYDKNRGYFWMEVDDPNYVYITITANGYSA